MASSYIYFDRQLLYTVSQINWYYVVLEVRDCMVMCTVKYDVCAVEALEQPVTLKLKSVRTEQ